MRGETTGERAHRAHAAVDAAWQAMSAEARSQAGGSRDNAVEQTERMDTPWMRYLVAYDPNTVAREQRITPEAPTLVGAPVRTSGRPTPNRER